MSERKRHASSSSSDDEREEKAKSDQPSTENPGDEDSDDDFVGPSLDDAQPQKKKRVLEYEHVYLDNIPCGINYERSFMHRDAVTRTIVTPTDFVVTASQDGHIKFWKKQEVGIEFVKHFRAHLGLINDVVVNANGSLLATMAADKAVKVFDVINFDMINMLKLDYVPATAAWVHKPGDAIPVLAVAEENSNVIRMYDGKGSTEVLKSLTIHQKPVVSLVYCVKHDIAVSADQGGMLEYWSGMGQDFGFPRSAKFDSKLDTDLYELAKNKTHVLNMTVSHNGELLVVMGEDRKIRMFKMVTGKMMFVIDESLAHYNQLQNVKQVLPPMEFGKKVSVEKELMRMGVYKYNNIVFDESDNFIIYSSLLGIKIVNLVTKSVSRLLAQREHLRPVNLALFQGRPKSLAFTANTTEIEASDNPSLTDKGTDPTLVTTAYKKNRFYLFTNRSSKDTSAVDNDRDVFNEKPSKEDIIAAAEEKGPPRLYQNATIHTTVGDIHLDLFPRECPKTVENFCVHARNGYYNGHLFHRVIRQFMIQTGDPLGTGTGGESIWGGEFEVELETNLREDFIITEKAPTRAFSLLKDSIKTLC